ncbi:hypothetical protein BDQ17DRAFT_1547257 [Cyathus striatus]|nr:hypothetical protein BDQ17DRAFT_1547257 [Cyathus striatus]
MSNYRQFRTGDINILNRIDKRVQVESIYSDFVVEVSGENKRKVARIYHGRRRYTLLKIELDLLSKMWPHPSIPQVFGVLELNDKAGLVFHDDGMRRRRGEYILSLKPLQRAIFNIKYVSDYVDTYKYLGEYISAPPNSNYYTHLRFGNVMDQLKLDLEESTGTVDFYISSSGRLSTVLSIYNCDSQQHYSNFYGSIGNTWNPDRPLENLSRNDFELINKILDHVSTATIPHASMAQHISTYHRAFLSVMRTRYIPTSHKIECILGHPVIIWPSPPEAISSYIHYISGHFEIIQRNSNSWSISSNLFKEMQHVCQFTCFKLKTDAITQATFRGSNHINISFVNNCSISDDTYLHWLYQAPQILESHAVICNHKTSNYLGIVSGVNIRFDISIYVSPIIRYLESNADAEIYFFIPDACIYPVDGKVLELHSFWSLDKSGAEPLTEYSAALIGLSGAYINITPRVSYLETFYYQALRDLYKLYRITKYDILQCAGAYKFKQGRRKFSVYLDDMGFDYFKTHHERKKDTELKWHYWNERSSSTAEDLTRYFWDPERFNPEVISPNISLLSWIGVTRLEDCFSLVGTVFETRYIRNRRRKCWEMYRVMNFRKADEDDWEDITHIDLEGDEFDMERFELI